MVCRTMLKLIAILGVFFNCLSILAAEATTADAGPVVSTVTWDKEFRPIYPEAASYPRATALSDGRVMMTFAHPTSVGKAIACVFSSDGGKTWAGYRRICEHPHAGGSRQCVSPATGRWDRAGSLPSSRPQGSHLPHRSLVEQGREPVGCPIHRRHRDTGNLGTVPAVVARWHGSGVLRQRRRLLPGPADRNADIDGRRHVLGDADDGRRKKGSRDGMPGVVRLNGQELLVVFEAQDQPPFRFVIRGVRSSDLGRTWSATRQLIYRPNNLVAAPWAAGAPSIIRLPDGRLMVSFQSDENNAFVAGDRRRDPTHSKYDYLWHTHFACVTSVDQGKSWTAPVHLLGGPDDPANWNALQVLNDGTVLALSNHRGRIWVKAGTTDGTPGP